MKTPSLYDRIYGGLLGSAVGDALGAPFECMHYRDVRDAYRDAETFEQIERAADDAGRRPVHPVGSVTDDTVLADLLLDCILAYDGRVSAHEFARAWETFDRPIETPDGEPLNRLDHVHWIERIPFYRNRLREIPKRELGHGEANATNAVMYIAPVGLLCAGDPLTAELMAADVTAVNQHGRPRDVAAGYCAALATCFLPEATVDELVATGIQRTGDYKHVKEMRAMVDLARDCRSCEQYIERYYEEIIGPHVPLRDLQHDDRPASFSVSWNSSEVLGVTLAMLTVTDGEDVRAMLLGCAKIGRDADTIARVAGGLIGAWRGADCIPTEWGDYVLSRNEWLRLEDKAARLTELVQRRLREGIANSRCLLGGEDEA